MVKALLESAFIFTVLAASSGCANVLGVEDINISLQSDGGVVPQDGDVVVVVDPKVECVSDEQCTPKLPLVDPAGCAIAKCLKNICTYAALDKDGDGFSVKCASRDPLRLIAQSKTSDCDDANPGVVPGSETDCTDGTFTLPAVGACRAGKHKCNPDGTFAMCVGATGKHPDLCTGGGDLDCDGIPNNGPTCSCSNGFTQSCGPAQAIGICKFGSTSCVSGTFSACTGAILAKPRDCTSALDNDCNGYVDRDEPGCKCDGSVAPGTPRACATTLSGVCGPGTQTCIVSPVSALWGSCAGNVNPATVVRNCNGTADADCNGTIDPQESACRCNGVTPIGTTVSCSVAGCPGTKTCNSTGSGAVFGFCATLLLPANCLR
jgi:hypothetical protein